MLGIEFLAKIPKVGIHKVNEDVGSGKLVLLFKFLKAALMACFASKRLNLSASVIAASLTSSSSSSSSPVLMLRGVSSNSGVSWRSGDAQVIPSGVGSIGVTWIGVGGSVFL